MTKKNRLKQIVLILLAIMLVSFLIGGIGLLIERASYLDKKRDSQFIHQEKEFPAAAIQSLSIEAISSHIKIIPALDQNLIKVKFHGKTYNDSPRLLTDQKDTLLSVTIIHPEQSINFFDFDWVDKWVESELEIYLPAAYLYHLKIKTVSGDIESDHFQFASLEVKTISGDMTAGNLKCDQLSFDTTSGDLILAAYTGQTEMHSVSGSLNIQYKHFNSNLHFQSTSGSANLEIKDPPQAKIRFKTVSGNFESDFALSMPDQSLKRNHIKGQIGSGTHLIDVKTISGSFMIHKQ